MNNTSTRGTLAAAGPGHSRDASPPSADLPRAGGHPHIGTMNLELSDAEAEALTQELAGTINYARYPLSPRIQTLRAILGKLRPEPVREPLPPLKVYEPPSKGRYRRRG
jgi:hypothetical protein